MEPAKEPLSLLSLSLCIPSPAQSLSLKKKVLKCRNRPISCCVLYSHRNSNRCFALCLFFLTSCIPDQNVMYISNEMPPLPPTFLPSHHEHVTDSFWSQSNATSSEKSSLTTLVEVASESVCHIVQFHLFLNPYHDPESFHLPARCLFPQLARKFHVDGDSE